MTHLAWDEGAIETAITEVLGFYVPTKTKKTYCGKTVKTAAINNHNPSCQTCTDKWLHKVCDMDKLAEYARSLS